MNIIQSEYAGYCIKCRDNNIEPKLYAQFKEEYLKEQANNTK